MTTAVITRQDDTAPPSALNFYDTRAHEVAAQVRPLRYTASGVDGENGPERGRPRRLFVMFACVEVVMCGVKDNHKRGDARELTGATSLTAVCDIGDLWPGQEGKAFSLSA
jgi:hypothetical protein